MVIRYPITNEVRNALQRFPCIARQVGSRLPSTPVGASWKLSACSAIRITNISKIYWPSWTTIFLRREVSVNAFLSRPIHCNSISAVGIRFACASSERRRSRECATGFRPAGNQTRRHRPDRRFVSSTRRSLLPCGFFRLPVSRAVSPHDVQVPRSRCRLRGSASARTQKRKPRFMEPLLRLRYRQRNGCSPVARQFERGSKAMDNGCESGRLSSISGAHRIASIVRNA